MGAEDVDVEAELALHLRVALKRLPVGLARQEEQVAHLAEARVPARLLGESEQLLDAEHREADVQLARKLLPDAAGSAARGAGAKGRPLDDDDVGESARGDVVRDARADDAPTDDHYRRRIRHGHLHPQHTSRCLS